MLQVANVCRNLRKIKLLLNALEQAGKHVDYYALDLDRTELERTLAVIAPLAWKHVKCFGLHGTYDDGLAWLSHCQHQSRPKVILSLGWSGPLLLCIEPELID